MRPIALVDLDDTLFQTRRKCPLHWPAERLEPLAVDRDGAPLSFATPPQQVFLRWLLQGAQVIPVTARSLDALRRVRLPQGLAVCAHGGLILDGDGLPEPAWSARMAAEAQSQRPALQDLAARAQALAASAGRVRVRVLAEGGTELYLLLKPAEGGCERDLADIVARLATEAPAGWTVHHNGSNAAFLPPFLGKAHAVEALLKRLRAAAPEAPVVGVGDSLTDAPFLALCDYAMTPSGSQLADRLLQVAA